MRILEPKTCKWIYFWCVIYRYFTASVLTFNVVFWENINIITIELEWFSETCKIRYYMTLSVKVDIFFLFWGPFFWDHEPLKWPIWFWNLKCISILFVCYVNTSFSNYYVFFIWKSIKIQGCFSKRVGVRRGLWTLFEKLWLIFEHLYSLIWITLVQTKKMMYYTTY